MFSLLDKILMAVSTIVLPNSAKELYSSYKQGNRDANTMISACAEGVRAAKKGSIEGRTLRALLCTSLPGDEIQCLLGACTSDDDDSNGRDSKEGDGVSLSGKEHINTDEFASSASQNESDLSSITCNRYKCGVVGCMIDADGEEGTATGHNCSVCNGSVHILCCQRILGISVEDVNDALCCTKCFAKHGDKSNPADAPDLPQSARGVKRVHEEDIGTSVRQKKRRRSGSMARSYARARTDWDCIRNDGLVPLVVRTLKRCSNETIRDALKFLFSPGNVQLLSWGTKRVRIDGKWENFPAVMRTATCEKIYMQYKAQHEGSHREQGDHFRAVGRTTFVQIAQILTRGQRKRKSAVDYVLGALVYDNLRCARDVVSGEVESEDLRRVLANQLDAVEEFLKFTYLEHIDVDEDCFHDSNFALQPPTNGDSTAKTSGCKTCITPFQVIRNVEVALRERRDDIVSVLRDVSHKVSLYMGHQHRCHNQEKRIAALFKELKQDKHCSSAIILVDYKMKFEAIRFREKTTEFFGKRGMSWHGAVVFYSSISAERRAEGTQVDLHETVADELQTLFFDHILTNDMTQDVGAVASLLDAILARLKVELPSVTQFYLLSDNARCSQNDLIPVIAPFIAQSHKLVMKGFIHSETQRGKSLVDAHFALAMMHINRYCNETRKDVTTPAEVVEAPNSFSGTANCTAEMVHLDRNHKVLQQWLTSLRHKKLARLGRVNEFLYSPIQNKETVVKCYRLSGRSYSTYKFGLFHSALQPDGNSGANKSGDIEDDSEETIGEDNGGKTSNTEDPYFTIFNREEIAFRSEVTGVSVWARARLRRMLRRRSRTKAKEKSVSDISLLQEELKEKEEEGYGSESEKMIANIALLNCEKCDKVYRRQDAFTKRQEKCTGYHTSQDVISRACRMAFRMLESQDVPIYTTQDIHPSVLSMSIDRDVIERYSMMKGWAQRPPYGKTLGENTVNRFAMDLEKWFMEGQLDKGKKISPSRMREMLQKKYPDRYDIPGESFITSYISAQIRKHKKAGNASSMSYGSANGAVTSLARRNTTAVARCIMPALYAGKLADILRDNRSLMPRHARSAVIAALALDEKALPDDFPTEQAIKNKVSSLKVSLRRYEG